MRSERPLPPGLAAPWLMLGLQYGRFIVVGFFATLAHVLAFAGSIELLGLAPLAANTLGFAVGVNVSYLGNDRWTFRSNRAGRAGLTRFWVVALAGFGLNTLFVHLVTVCGFAYGWAIPLIAGVTPLATFLFSKFWAFRG